MDVYAEEQRAIKQARVLRRLRPEEVRVDLWLNCWRYLFPGARERESASKEDLFYAYRPFRRRYGQRAVGSITAIEAQAWALKHPGQVKLLRQAWDRAVAMQVAPLNVWKLVVLPPRKGERRRPPTAVEFFGILSRASRDVGPDFADLILVAAYSGARQGGLVRVRVPDVDLGAGRLKVTEKGRKSRSVVLCGASRDAVARQVERRRRLPYSEMGKAPFLWTMGVTPGPGHPNRPLSGDTVQKRWREVRGDFPHGFHALRHFCATWLAEHGVDRRDIAVQLGHTDSEGRPYADLVERVYDHPDPELALARVASIAGGAI